MDIEIFTWQDFDTAVRTLVAKVKASERILSAVYGIPRGGLPLAVALSHHLNLPLLKSPPVILLNRVLVVDDISDSGETLHEYAACATATIHIVPGTGFIPDFYVHNRNAMWVLYPWEVAP